MSLEENCQKIDEYIHCTVKLKSSCALKKDSQILENVGLEYEEVGGLIFAFMVFQP